jgi:hypothetical protein
MKAYLMLDRRREVTQRQGEEVLRGCERVSMGIVDGKSRSALTRARRGVPDEV